MVPNMLPRIVDALAEDEHARIGFERDVERFVGWRAT